MAIKIDVEKYSPIAKFLGLSALVLVFLAFFKSPPPPEEYDERCFYDHCVERCGEMEYRFGRFDYGERVRCFCKTNITEISVQLYSLDGSECPPVTRDRRCDESFCEETCMKDEGFLPNHSSLVLEDGWYVCICRDMDVGWYEEAYHVEAFKCSS